MSGELKELLKLSEAVQMTDEQKELQRRSFAYGNSKIENDRITRETINHEADNLAKESSGQG